MTLSGDFLINQKTLPKILTILMYSRAKTTEKFNYAWITLIMNFHDQHFSVDYCNYRKLYDNYLSSIAAIRTTLNGVSQVF